MTLRELLGLCLCSILILHLMGFSFFNIAVMGQGSSSSVKRQVNPFQVQPNKVRLRPPSARIVIPVPHLTLVLLMLLSSGADCLFASL